MSIAIGDPLPALTLAASGGQTIDLGSLQGRNLVIYFYPKDNTPGCTQEGKDFRDHHADFARAKTDIYGVSRDSVRKHDNFCAKYEFPFTLLADEDESLCRAFDVIKEKNMYGRKYLGIERSTFLFDSSGKLSHEWRAVKVKGHVEDVLTAARSL